MYLPQRPENFNKQRKHRASVSWGDEKSRSERGGFLPIWLGKTDARLENFWQRHVKHKLLLGDSRFSITRSNRKNVSRKGAIRWHAKMAMKTGPILTMDYSLILTAKRWIEKVLRPVTRSMSIQRITR